MLFHLAVISLAASLATPSQKSAQEMPSHTQLELLRSEWDRKPEDMRTALLLGGQLQAGGQPAEARAIVERSLEALAQKIATEGDSAQGHYMLGMGALFLGRNYLARERFQLALSLQPEREEIHLGLVRALLRLEKEDEAREALELARTLFPESDGVKAQLAELHERSGRYEQAVPLLEELRALHPEDLAVLGRLIAAYAETENIEKAAPLVEVLVEKGVLNGVEASLKLFRMRLEQGDLRGARVELQQAARVEEHHPEVKRAFRDYYAAQAEQAAAGGNQRRAALFWERALERDPADRATQYRLALAHAATQAHDKALEYYLPLLEQRPANPRFYADLSLTLIALGRLDAADKVIRLGGELAATEPDDAAREQLRLAQVRLREAARRVESSATPIE